MIRFPCAAALCVAMLSPALPSQAGESGPCSLLEADTVAEAIGIPVVNVVERVGSRFGSCSFETDDWTQTFGLIFFPGLAATSEEALAAEIRTDLDRDGVEYAELTVEAGLGVPAVYYRSPEGDAHTVVLQAGGDRIILTGSNRAAVLSLAQSALQAVSG